MIEFAGDRGLRNRVIALCIAINMLDGFDIMAMAYTAPSIGKAWTLSPEQLGMLFSVGLAGMMIGSMVIGLLADRTGRRPMILACLAIGAGGMFAASQAPGLLPLGLARFLTGLAIGGILPCINTMVAEFARPQTRSMAVSLMQAGFAVGASAGGFLAVVLLKLWGWHAVFLCGAVLTALLVPITYFAMPESIAFLARQPARTTEFQTLLARLGEGEPASAAVAAQSEPKPGLRALGQYRVPLLLIFTIWFLCVMAFYFLNSWVPKILADGGLGEGQAVAAGAMLTAGGVISALTLGWLSLRRSIVHIVAAATLGSALMTGLFGQIPSQLLLLLAGAFVLGLLTNATQIGIYALVPGLFPPAVRAGATGLAIGMGRLGSVVGPWLAGSLLAAGWAAPSLFFLMALPYLGAALLMLGLRGWLRY